MLPRPISIPGPHVPLYRQLYDFLGELVRGGKLVRGERLPATRELAGTLGLNRATVSAAYELLEAEGLITRQVGRGSFVTGGRAAEGRPLDWARLLERPESLTLAPPIPVEPGGISFASSRPAEDLFPLDDFRSCCAEVIGRTRPSRDPAARLAFRLRAAARAPDRKRPRGGHAEAGRRSDRDQRLPAGARPAGARAVAARRRGGHRRPRLSRACETCWRSAAHGWWACRRAPRAWMWRTWSGAPRANASS